MFTQLDPPLPLETPHGSGLAYAVIDYGPDFDLLWVVFDDDTGECWTWPNPQVRAPKNITLGRRTQENGRASSQQPSSAKNGHRLDRVAGHHPDTTPETRRPDR